MRRSQALLLRESISPRRRRWLSAAPTLGERVLTPSEIYRGLGEHVVGQSGVKRVLANVLYDG